MSTRLVGWALRDAPETHTKLSMGARLLLVYLADHFNEDEGAAWPSQARLAKYMGCSERSIRNYLDELITAGIVTKTFRKGTSLIYRFAIVRQNMPHTKGKVRQNMPPGPARSAANPGNNYRLTNKETINEPEQADPKAIASMIENLKKDLLGRNTGKD